MLLFINATNTFRNAVFEKIILSECPCFSSNNILNNAQYGFIGVPH